MVGIGGRRRAGAGARRVGTALVTGIVLAGLCAPAGIAATTGADRAATHAYLLAQYRYARAIIADAKAAAGTLGGFYSALGTECKGVLTNSPGRDETPRGGPLGPRASGEAARGRDQRFAIDLELNRGALRAADAVFGPAETAFDAAVRPLRWSDPRVAAAVAEYLAQDVARSAPSSSEVCADLRAWAQSGFRRLAPRTRELQAQLRSAFEAQQPSPESLLRRYEGPAERALIARTRRLETGGGLRAFYTQLASLGTRLNVALGIKEHAFRRPPDPISLGRGVTRAGARFSVTLESLQGSHRRGCRVEVSVSYAITPGDQETGLLFSAASGGNVCVAGRDAQHDPRLQCESGLLTITQVVPAQVRRVRLQLANGRSVTSPVISISARHGGPAGLYVQALDRLASRPVAVTELDARGATVRTVEIPAHPRCPPRSAEEPHFAKLAHGSTPTGTSFAIEAVQFPGAGPGSLNLDLNSGPLSGREADLPARPTNRFFSWSVGAECPPAEWAIFYGVLKQPGVSVTAATASGEVPLTIVPIPSRLHAGGVLAYGVFATTPARLTVRDASGRVIASDDLLPEARKHREYCEGYAEA